MPQEQLANEVRYKLSVEILKCLLVEGFITEGEYRRINELNLISFSPALSELYS